MTIAPDERRIAVTVPELGVGNETLRISAWLVEPGQTVVAGDHLAEVLIPGITYEIAASHTGELAQIVRYADSVVSTGDIIGWISVESSSP